MSNIDWLTNRINSNVVSKLHYEFLFKVKESTLIPRTLRPLVYHRLGGQVCNLAHCRYDLNNTVFRARLFTQQFLRLQCLKT